METMINENGRTFKEIEQEMFRFGCQLCRQLTAQLLEATDQELFRNRDRQKYRSKGLRQTTVKTVYGEVTYSRHVYVTMDEHGAKHCRYLLDEALRMENTGLISENLSEILVSEITEMSYRECAEKVSRMTGQAISPMGVWNIIQSLGDKVMREEKSLVKAHRQGKLRGVREARVLFEEADGVWLSLQGEDRKKSANGKAEMRLAIAYDGWKETGKGRYELDGKVATAGFGPSSEFQALREATVASIYDLDIPEFRILNGDGAGWIRNVPEEDMVFQLDPFHRNKAIREGLRDKKAVREVHEYLKEQDVDGLFSYLRTLQESVPEEEDRVRIEELIRYLEGSRDGLVSYRERGLKIPESPEGLCYRNMGTMENHVSTIIAHRMKGRRGSWSIRGGNHLAKILAKKYMGRLYEVTERAVVRVIRDEDAEKVMSAAASRERVGKGYAYGLRGHVPALDARTTGDGRMRHLLSEC